MKMSQWRRAVENIARLKALSDVLVADGSMWLVR